MDTTSKERKRQAYHTTLLPHHITRLNLITDKLRDRFASITAMLFPLTIITHCTKDSSSNKPTKYEC